MKKHVFDNFLKVFLGKSLVDLLYTKNVLNKFKLK